MDDRLLYDATLEQLNRSRSRMLSPEGHAAIAALSPLERLRAMHELETIQQTISAVANAQVHKIITGFDTNRAALEDGIRANHAALENISCIADVISTASTIISIIGKVIKIV
jgi:hypothetical protein